MEWLDLQQRIDAGEDERTEFGRYRSWGDKDWLKSVCAMANSQGGLVVLGVLDDGRVEGVPLDSEQVQKRLTNALQNGLSRPVRARIGRHEAAGATVHWLEVDRMRGPEPMKYAGRVYVRRGRSSAEPEGSELQELYNVFGLVLTEERIIPDTSVADIEGEVFRAYMRRRGIDLGGDLELEVDLRNREVLDEDIDGRLRATLFGLLGFGRAPQDHPPTRNFYIDSVAYAGVSRADEVLSSGQARGRLDEQVKRAEDWLRSLGRTEHYRGLNREDRYILPLPAFRECLVNAVAHRDYSILGSQVLVEIFDDRVVVTSPGALPNHKRPESVMAGGVPRSRNEAMANLLLDLGLMERRGSGFPRIIREMQQFNGTRPTLDNDREERWVRVTLWRLPEGDRIAGSLIEGR